MHGFCTVFTLFWSIQLKCLQLSLSSSCIRSRASNAMWLYPDFLAPIYPTQTLQYSAHATLLHHTLAWLYQIVLLSDSTLLCYTLLSPPVLWLSLLYSTPLYAYWSYSLHYQTLFDCSVHYHGFVPAWLYCTLRWPYHTRWFYIWSILSLYDVPCYRLRILHVRSLLGSTFILYHVLPNQGSTNCMQIAYYGGKVDGDRSIWYSSYSRKWETLYMATVFFVVSACHTCMCCR